MTDEKLAILQRLADELGHKAKWHRARADFDETLEEYQSVMRLFRVYNAQADALTDALQILRGDAELRARDAEQDIVSVKIKRHRTPDGKPTCSKADDENCPFMDSRDTCVFDERSLLKTYDIGAYLRPMANCPLWKERGEA